MYCPKCGKEISDDFAYCPYCGAQIKAVASKRTSFPTAGGILGIIASCICVFLAIVCIAESPYSYFGAIEFLVGLFGIIGFPLGLTGGILMLKRKTFSLAIIGISLVLVFGALLIPLSALLGLPIIVLSVLSLVFTAISRGEFT
jgi:hypothetical protein